jgi:demethylmenaquinone methyltransferase / 2-methoxy-6-polyprenyl-1,4-benzoquinol methylase
MATVKPYTAEGSKTTQVGKMFDNIAPYYDFLNRFLSLGIDTLWRKKAIDQLATLQPRTVLDVATGTADVAIEMSKRLKSVEKIVGFDLSKEMLEIGKTKIAARNLGSLIELKQGDSENLPFADASFDAITVAFGVRNFENLEKGIAEMQRVLKPGGKLVVLEFSRPTIFPFKQLFNSYFKYVLPQIGRLTSKDPRAYSYLYESVQAFPDGNNFLSILSKNGFNSNEWKPLSLGICSIYCGTK